MQKGRDHRLTASAALALVTLGVFGLCRDYGPESAIRRFHHGLATNDPAEIAQVVTLDIHTSAVQELERLAVGAYAQNGGTYRIATSKRSDDQVEMLATYGESSAIVWVVVKGRDRWRIDPYLTIQGIRKQGY